MSVVFCFPITSRFRSRPRSPTGIGIFVFDRSRRSGRNPCLDHTGMESIHSFARSFAQLITRSPSNALTRLFTHSPTHPLTHLLTYSLTKDIHRKERKKKRRKKIYAYAHAHIHTHNRIYYRLIFTEVCRSLTVRCTSNLLSIKYLSVKSLLIYLYPKWNYQMKVLDIFSILQATYFF